jgi:ABC-2 type transport system ATP-binding protein
MTTETSDATLDATDRGSEQPMIQADRLSKFYGIFAATREVSFNVYQGEVVAFLGPNGAGKSTTMKILTGYLSPSQGVAKIAGHDMNTDRLEGSKRLGYLPETGPLYPEMTPYSLLDFFAEARGMNKKTKINQIAKAVELCALGSVIYKPINKLSKGYRQRVGMAQALIHEPEVLILDEPTSGLDPNQIRGVRETIKRLGQEKTILLSTHILQEVEAMADRVIMINEGRKVYDGLLEDMDPEGLGLDHVFANLTGHDPDTGVKLKDSQLNPELAETANRGIEKSTANSTNDTNDEAANSIGPADSQAPTDNSDASPNSD